MLLTKKDGCPFVIDSHDINGKHNNIENIIFDVKIVWEYYFNFSFDYEDYCEGETILDKMLNDLKEYEPYFVEYVSKIFHYLNFKQYDRYILVRYKDMTELYSDVSPEEYWSLYDGLYRKCRTVVYDIVSEKCVLHGYDKFFNVNELNETNIDTVISYSKTASLFEVSNKLDGSMVLASKIKNGPILLATSNSINSETSWRLNLAYSLLTVEIYNMLYDNEGDTFIFEMITPEDSHIVNYSETDYGLHLIGIRKVLFDDNMDNSFMVNYKNVINIATEYGVKTTETFNMTIDEIMSQLESKSCNEAEGFVIRVNDNFYKIKYHEYVQMHKILSGMVSPNAVIDAIKRGVYDDFRSKIPSSYHNRVNEIASIVFKCMNELCEYVEERTHFIEINFSDIKDKMKFISNEIPKELQSYVRNCVIKRKYGLFSKNSTPKLNNIEFLLQLIRQEKKN